MADNCKPIGETPTKEAEDLRRAVGVTSKVRHVSGKRPESCQHGIRVESNECLDSLLGARGVKETLRTLNERALVKIGVSHVLLVRGGPIGWA